MKRADFNRYWRKSGLKTPDKPKIFIKRNVWNHSYHQFYPVLAKIRNPLCPAIAIILAQGLQRYNSPANWARKLFKPSTDSASLLVEIEKKLFRFGFVVLWGRTSQVGVSFSFYWPSLRGPGRQSNGPIVSLKFCLETRLSYQSLEPLIDFLAYLDQKLCHTN